MIPGRSIGAALFALCAVMGCASTPSGVKVVASAATYTNIGDINWDEYKIPVMSIYMGPKTTVWINKDYTRVTDVEVFGSVTNATAALAIYNSQEQKSVNLKMHFSPTNAVTTIKEQ